MREIEGKKKEYVGKSESRPRAFHIACLIVIYSQYFKMFQ